MVNDIQEFENLVKEHYPNATKVEIETMCLGWQLACKFQLNKDYRMLTTCDTIQVGDEFLEEDGTYRAVCKSEWAVGLRYNTELKPARRRIVNDSTERSQ